MHLQDKQIMGIFESLIRAAQQHQGDSVLLLQTLLAASSIVEGIPGEEARQVEQMIDACVMTTQRTLNSIQESRGELHEMKMDVGQALFHQRTSIGERRDDHRQ